MPFPIFSLTGGFVMHLLIGSLICSGTRYVGEYLPLPKPFAAAMALADAAAAAERGDPRGLEFIIILVWSGEYIMPAAYIVKCFLIWFAVERCNSQLKCDKLKMQMCEEEKKSKLHT